MTFGASKNRRKKELAGWIDDVLAHTKEKAVLERIRGQARELGQHFPAPA